MSFVSVKCHSQTQDCKEHGLRLGGGRSHAPASASRPPRACNCDQYLKVSKDVTQQLVCLSGHHKGPRRTGDEAQSEDAQEPGKHRGCKLRTLATPDRAGAWPSRGAALRAWSRPVNPGSLRRTEQRGSGD